MNVLIVSDLETYGGAAIAASRLADGLLGAGCRVTRVVGIPDVQGHAPEIRVLQDGRSVLTRLVDRIRQPRAIRRGHRSQAKSLSRIIQDVRPDVVNVHNIHAAHWGPDVLDACQGASAMVWTLHDMWSFTGRCVYNFDCRKFETGCDASCPTWMDYPHVAPKRIADEWEWRRLFLERSSGPIAISPSRWLATEARRGLWASRRVEVIPNGLPLDVYRPIDRVSARAALDLPNDGLLLVAAAVNISERRKGGTLLAEALTFVKTRPLNLAVMGHGKIDLDLPGIRILPLGYIDQERTKVLAYSAADVFVHPAPVDNLPNVVMEAIACGTPVVGFPVGGVPDMVRPGTTGWLATALSGQALAVAIDSACDAVRGNMDYRNACRSVAEAEYGVGLQARRYIELFQETRDTSSQS